MWDASEIFGVAIVVLVLIALAVLDKEDSI